MNNKTVLPTILAGLLYGTGWLYPNTPFCAFSSWAGTIFLIVVFLTTQTRKSFYLSSYIVGLLTNGIGFYWMLGTVKDFGGYTFFPACLIYLIFVLATSIQFLVAVFLYRNIPFKFIDKLFLRGAIAWVVSEFITFKLFPWQVGHTQLAFTHLVQIADIGGVYFISFLLFWCCETLVQCLRRFSFLSLLAPTTLLCTLAYGQFQINHYEREMVQLPQQDVALVQASLPIELYKQNTELFHYITKQATSRYKEKGRKGNLLFVWPESSIMEFIFDKIDSASLDLRLPQQTDNNAFLLGAMTAKRTPEKITRYNSALGIFSNGRIPTPYHKRILLPYGEYIPLAETFPSLKKLNPLAAEAFDAGDSASVFNYDLIDTAGTPYSLKVSPLICYEEVLSDLTRESVLAGAEVLVSLSNDVWFGETVAPLQHHQLAAFRAVENRRFLIRSTKTGFSANVNPLGITTDSIKPFTNDYTTTTISPLSTITIYTRIGNSPFFILSVAIIFSILLSFFRKWRKKSK